MAQGRGVRRALVASSIPGQHPGGLLGAIADLARQPDFGNAGAVGDGATSAVGGAAAHSPEPDRARGASGTTGADWQSGTMRMHGPHVPGGCIQRCWAAGGSRGPARRAGLRSGGLSTRVARLAGGDDPPTQPWVRRSITKRISSVTPTAASCSSPSASGRCSPPSSVPEDHPAAQDTRQGVGFYRVLHAGATAGTTPHEKRAEAANGAGTVRPPVAV